MKSIYLALTAIGTVLPLLFFVDWFAAAGFSPLSFLGAAFANDAASGLSTDLLVSSLAFWVFLASRRTPRVWLYVLLTLAVGLSCALPYYLYVQARAAERRTGHVAAA